jgi:HlyD family secretion protein
VAAETSDISIEGKRVMNIKKWTIILIAVLLIGSAGYYYWQMRIASKLPEGIVAANGRIEAQQINISSKIASRILEINVEEGAMVHVGQIVARLDDEELTAQLHRSEAEVRRLTRAKDEAEASVDIYDSQLKLAKQMLDRTKKLHDNSFASTERLQLKTSEYLSARASHSLALAHVEQSAEAITSAKQEVKRVKAQLKDTVLKAPIRGRVQYRLMEPGEVVAAGGNVLTVLDLADVYMTVFLPSREAGPLAVGSDARIILDPIPQYVIPAKVSFVSAEAQFTPKAVETAEERAKLMFRVKTKIDPTILRKYEDRVKAGVRGTAYMRIPPADHWPDNLQVVLPE